MYNRFIPQNDEEVWVETGPAQGIYSGSEPKKEGGRLFGWGSLFRGQDRKDGLSGVLSLLRLSELDMGDLLMLAIAGLLLADGEDVDLGIALILVFLLDDPGNKSGMAENDG